MSTIQNLLNEYKALKSQITTEDFKEKEINIIALKISGLPNREFNECMKLGIEQGLIQSDEDGWDFIE